MRWIHLIGIAALLSGCTALDTPQDFVRNGNKRVSTSDKTPELAAVCMENNANKYGRGMTGLVRIGEEMGAREVIVRFQGTTVPIVMLVALLYPQGTGSRVVVHTAPGSAEDLAAATLKGC